MCFIKVLFNIFAYYCYNLANYMPYELRSKTTRPSNSDSPASSRFTATPHAPPTSSRSTEPAHAHAALHTNASVPTMTSFLSDFRAALLDPVVLEALGAVIEKKNAELLANFDGRIQDLEGKVKLRDDRISALEMEIKSMKAEYSGVGTAVDDLEQYSRTNSVRIQHPHWIEDEHKDCRALLMDYAKDNNIELISSDIDACHRVGRKEPNKIRPILVKFIRRNHRDSLLKTRTKQRRDKSKIYVNEDLTPARARAAKEARALVNSNKIASSYVYSGKIVINTKDGQTFRITNIEQLTTYGHS